MGNANETFEIREDVEVDIELDEYSSEIEVDNYERLNREKIVRIMVRI